MIMLVYYTIQKGILKVYTFGITSQRWFTLLRGLKAWLQYFYLVFDLINGIIHHTFGIGQPSVYTAVT